ncbi:ATP synthase subunit g, mitochondrial-like [Sycon ciliatum]|uniref:ATP synthase subunit g, mitochondrial-like n=1 Tax=Sycon ciliatum TaxID=27933 RepID=UPI0031F6A0AE
MAAVAKSFATRGTRLVNFARPHLETFWGHAKRELGPPTDFGAVQREAQALFAKAPTFANTPVRRAAQNTLIAIEIAMWFYVGEVIGKRQLIAYPTK